MKNRTASAPVRRAVSSVIEQLEQRRLLSTVSVSLNEDGASSTLNITGTNGKDTVYIYDNPVLNVVEVRDGNTVHPFVDLNITDVEADMKKGDDTVEVQAISTYVNQVRSYDIELGSGNNHFSFSSPTAPAQGGGGSAQADPNGADIVDGSDISFSVGAQGGKDKVNFDLSRTSIIRSRVDINVNTEEGNDTVCLETPDFTQDEIGIIGSLELMEPVNPIQNGVTPAWALGDASIASELNVQVDLGEGNDVMNQTVRTTLNNNASFTENVLGDSGNDTFNDMEDFSLNEGGKFFVGTEPTIPQIDEIEPSQLSVTADLGSGNDIYAGKAVIANAPLPAPPTLGGTLAPDVTQFITQDPGIGIDYGSTATFNIQGSTGNDTLKFKDVQPTNTVIGLSGAEGFIDGTLVVNIHGGRGNDNEELDLDPDTGLNVSDEGVVRGVISGDDGKDTVRLDMRVSEESFGTYDLSVLGGDDADVLRARFQNEDLLENTPDHYGQTGHILVDGGLGSDVYDTEGNGLFKVLSATNKETLENPIL